MDIDKEYELLKKLNFERISGTDSEQQACYLIKDELKKSGIKSSIEEFDVVRNQVHKVKFEVLEPYQMVYEATAYMGCINTTKEGLICDLAYFESDTEVSRKRVEGKIALVNGYLNMKTFKALMEANAKGFITFNGDVDQKENDLDPRELRSVLQEFGNVPGVNLKVHDAMELIEKRASKVKIVVDQEMIHTKSYNLICDFNYGSEDLVAVTAHYDSVPNSKGVYDNATGSVCLYAMALKLKDLKLKHNVRLIWCGSEERGLLGSKAYVKDHCNELENIKLSVNIDMIGSIMGKRIAVSTADMSLVHFIDYYAKMKGYPLESKQGVYSSDSTPFADMGVPAVSFARCTAPGTGRIHCRFDVIEHLSKHMLEEDTQFIFEFVKDMANAYVIPLIREIPDNMKEELDKYLGRDLLKKDNEKKDDQAC